MKIGAPQDYFIHPGYTCRMENLAFDDTPFTDEFQKEVYFFARKICDRDKLKSVCDIGCGSGFKLMANFHDLDTVGIEVVETCEFLKAKWPERRWAVSGLDAPPVFSKEMVISADVIEHLPCPDKLLKYIVQMKPEDIVLSTPERELASGATDGPPKNVHHVREWNFDEFDAYIASWFDIERHFICDQHTQVILCHIKSTRFWR